MSNSRITSPMMVAAWFSGIVERHADDLDDIDKEIEACNEALDVIVEIGAYFADQRPAGDRVANIVLDATKELAMIAHRGGVS